MPTTRSELSELALNAAIELHSANQNDGDTGTAVDQFLKVMMDELIDDQNGWILKDASFYPVYAHALRGDNQSPISNRTNVMADVRQLLQAPNSESGGDNGDIPTLEAFCLAIHEALVTDVMTNWNTVEQRDRRAG